MTDQLTLGRVTLHVPPGTADRERWRRRVIDALRRVSLTPKLPPQVILVIRRVTDPRPGLLLGEDSWRGVRQWSGATQVCLDACWRRALRPAAESVPAAADAVWFADVAEWLACLSWDIHRGQTARWWWQTWLPQLGSGDRGNLLFRLWQREPRALPQAIAMLWERERLGVQTILLYMTPAQASHIRHLVAEAYDLPAAIPIATSAATPWESGEHQILETLRPVLPDAARSVVAGLFVEAAALASVCLGLAHAPLAVRRSLRAAPDPEAGRVQARADGDSDPQATRPRASPDGQEDSRAVVVKEVSSAHTDADGERASPPRDGMDPTHGRQDPSVPEDRQSTGDAGFAPLVHIPTQLRGDGEKVEESPAPAVGVADTELVARSPIADTVADTNEHWTMPTDSPAMGSPWTHDKQGISTGLGGIWYLVNVLADLAWVDDGAYKLDGWHKLAGLAESLLAHRPADPVWEVLAAQSTEPASSAVLARWLAKAVPAVQEYLAMRLENPAVFLEALHDSAQLYVTQTHVDVLFTLEQIRLELRIAGVDRNPGWELEIARVVSLRYE